MTAVEPATGTPSRPSRRVSWVALGVAVVLAGFFVILAIAKPDEGDQLGPQVKNFAAPTLVTETIDGTPFDLSQHRGRWVVLNFIASWCVPCKQEHPELVAFVAKVSELTRGKAYAQGGDSGGALFDGAVTDSAGEVLLGIASAVLNNDVTGYFEYGYQPEYQPLRLLDTRPGHLGEEGLGVAVLEEGRRLEVVGQSRHPEVPHSTWPEEPAGGTCRGNLQFRQDQGRGGRRETEGARRRSTATDLLPEKHRGRLPRRAEAASLNRVEGPLRERPLRSELQRDTAEMVP